MSTSTKSGTLTQEFVRKAGDDPVGALAVMFLAAFGVSLTTLIKIARQVLDQNDINTMMIAFTAGVQIRANVVFVGRDYGKIREKYPELVILGSRPQQDIYNFGALHALGHLLAHYSTEPAAKRVIEKAGSCITGEDKVDSEAGKINSEVAASWSVSEMAEVRAWLAIRESVSQANINRFAASIESLAAKFDPQTREPPPRPSAAGKSLGIA